MPEQFSRTKLLLGSKAMERLAASHIAVFGLGGVGSYAAESLARSGVGALTVVDGDIIGLTNLNRQLIATLSTIGIPKAEATRERLLSINPNLTVDERVCFFSPGTADEFDFGEFNYVIDAMDMVSAKLLLIETAIAAGTPVISCMGAGNKLDPKRFEVADISETSVCPLARVMRRELKRRGISHLKVVFSKEPPVPNIDMDGGDRRQAPGSVVWVTAVAGLILAGEAIKDIIAHPATERNFPT